MNTRKTRFRLRKALSAVSSMIVCCCTIAAAIAPAVAAEETGTKLGARAAAFTVNGEPAFLLGISYYGALSAPEEFIRRDLDDMKRYGFNWLRVWATWSAGNDDVSVVDANGTPRESLLAKLNWLVAECDRRGLVVDITLTRRVVGIADLKAHERAVREIVQALKHHSNWYLDLANERDIRDARYVSPAELKQLRELVRTLDPTRLVTASYGGHDLSKQDVRESLQTIGLDLLAVHRPRNAASPAQTEARTGECLRFAEQLGRTVPVHHQEPFRRGYGRWEPTADDFLTDLRGAIAGGAAGWCFHNGSQRGREGNRPFRSFDMREQRLFDQLDEEERKVVENVASALRSVQHEGRRPVGGVE